MSLTGRKCNAIEDSGAIAQGGPDSQKTHKYMRCAGSEAKRFEGGRANAGERKDQRKIIINGRGVEEDTRNLRRPVHTGCVC